MPVYPNGRTDIPCGRCDGFISSSHRIATDFDIRRMVIRHVLMQTAFPSTQLQNGDCLWIESSLKSVLLSKFAIFLRFVSPLTSTQGFPLFTQGWCGPACHLDLDLLQYFSHQTIERGSRKAAREAFMSKSVGRRLLL